MKIKLGQVVAGLLLLYLAYIAIILSKEGGVILTVLAGHLEALFRDARLFNAEFAQLILIAIFVGWAIHRFMNFFRKDEEEE